jgi:hypothetical protein
MSTDLDVSKCVAAVLEAMSAATRAEIVLEELLPLGTRVRVRVSCSFVATVARHVTAPHSGGIWVSVESLESLDTLWKPTAEKNDGQLKVPLDSIEIVERKKTRYAAAINSTRMG